MEELKSDLGKASHAIYLELRKLAEKYPGINFSLVTTEPQTKDQNIVLVDIEAKIIG